MAITDLERKLNILIEASLPAVAKNPQDLLKYYKDGLQFFYDDLQKNSFGIPKGQLAQNLEEYAKDIFSRWFYKVDELQTPEIRNLLEENKQKIYDKAKRDFKDFKPKGNTLDLVFWYTARDWYNNYLRKQESLIRKEKEEERKRQALEEKEAKKQARKEFIFIKDVFDKGSNDLIWKFLKNYEEKTINYFKKIKAEYLKLLETNNFYYDKLDKSGMKFYRLLNNDAKAAYLCQEKKYPIQDVAIALLPDSKIKKILADDIDFKYADLVKRIFSKTKNKITDVDLKISQTGNLNGYIYYDGGKIKVETILAWGEIYRPHYRVLVH